jgi:hypothetical protein
MAKIIRLISEQAFNSGKVSFDGDKLPAGYVIDDMFVVVDGTANVPAAGWPSDSQTRLIDSIECERRISGDGIGLSVLDWQNHGKDMVRPADLAVNAAADFKMAWPVGFRDRRGIDPTDAPTATEFYKGKLINVTFTKPSDLVAALAINAGTMTYLEVHLSERSPGKVPASTVFGFQEVSAKELKLPAGHLLDLVLYKKDGTAITAAELGKVWLDCDGRGDKLLEGVTSATLVRSFNRHIAAGAQVQGATDGVEGESLDPASMPFVSLWHPVPPYKGTKLPTAYQTFNLRIDGTLAMNVARVAYRLLEIRDESHVLRAGVKLGEQVDDNTVVAAKTASKNGVNRSIRGFLSGMAARLRRK